MAAFKCTADKTAFSFFCTLVIRRTVLHNSTVSGYSQDRTWQKTGNCYMFIVNIKALSVGDEFESYENFKRTIEEIPAYSVKLLIRKLVTIRISDRQVARSP